jgi:hypothetical protein
MLVVQFALAAGVQDWFHTEQVAIAGHAVAAVAGVQALPVPEHR